MADAKLNGAFYGPTIPPPEQPARGRRDRPRSRSCCWCLFSFFWKLLLALVLLVVLAFLIFLAVVQPRPFKLHVTQAKLTQFNHSDTNFTLYYNLVLNFTSHNPNRKLGVYYDYAEGDAFYEGSRLSTIDLIMWLDSFRQDAKQTKGINAVFSGQRVLGFDQGQQMEYQEDEKEGAYDIDVKVHFDIRFRLGDFIFNNLGSKARAKCGIKVPLSGSKGKILGPAFEPTKCRVIVKWFGA